VAQDQGEGTRKIDLWLTSDEGEERGFIELDGYQEFGNPVDFDVQAGDTALHLSYQFVYGVMDHAVGGESVVEYPVNAGDYGLFLLEQHELKRNEKSISSGMVLVFARVFGNRGGGPTGQ